jgi:hypothetical protein
MKDYWKKLFSMQDERIFGLVFLVLFLVFAFWKVTSSKKDAEKQFQELQSLYDQVTLETVFENNLRKTFYPPEWRGAGFIQYITLNDGRKFALRIDDCITHKEMYLDDIFPKQVRLIKNSGSDTLVIIDGKQKYLFKLKIEK